METILLVDDDLATLEIINECLRPYFRTRIATRGEKAIELARLSPAPHLVLLDVELPDMDGYEICAALKSDAQTAGMPESRPETLTEGRVFRFAQPPWDKRLQTPILAQIGRASCRERVSVVV